jgi:hypothetical protein
MRRTILGFLDEKLFLDEKKAPEETPDAFFLD